MRALIVGCGYVGISLAARLAREGHAVDGLRRNANADAEMRALGVNPLHGDITRPDTLRYFRSAYDWVVLCASSTGGDAEGYRRVYLNGTRNLLDWLAPASPQKLVYTGSTSVYGQTDGSAVSEVSPTVPAAETAQVLLQAEALLLAAARAGTVPAVVLRVAGIYGPGRGYWLKQLLEGTAQIEGGGERILNMIHRDDVAGAVVAALRQGQPGEIYNAVDDEPVTQLALFEWLSAQLDRPSPPFVPKTADESRKRGMTNKRVSNKKLKTQLGYSFQYPTFKEGYQTAR
jgi:nucleoside-diphosphate-sugar epimerase